MEEERAKTDPSGPDSTSISLYAGHQVRPFRLLRNRPQLGARTIRMPSYDAHPHIPHFLNIVRQGESDQAALVPGVKVLPTLPDLALGE